MKKFENIFVKENIKLFFILFGELALITTIINNFSIDKYIGKLVIPIVFLLGSYIYLIKRMKLDKNINAYYYLIPIVSVICSGFMSHMAETNRFLNTIVLPILISIFLYSLVNNKYKPSRKILFDFFKLFPNRLFSNLEYIDMLKREKKNTKKMDNIIVGLCIGGPIALLLLVLLCSADKYFSIFIGNVFSKVFEILDLSNILPNLTMIFITFCVLFSVFINLLRNRNISVEISETKSINNQIASVVLGTISVVFCLFIISEISKLTTNFLHLPIEYTYAMYAREGFFQLLFVTLINICIIIYFIYYTKSISENKLIKIMISLIIAFSILLVFNSYYRMFLYISTYGFTVLRLQVILFLLMEFILFTILLLKVLKNIKYNEVLTYFVIIVTTYIINLYLCNQPIIDLINKILHFNTNI